MSRTHGRQYWFNKRTGASVFEEPAEVAAARNAVAVPAPVPAPPRVAATIPLLAPVLLPGAAPIVPPPSVVRCEVVAAASVPPQLPPLPPQLPQRDAVPHRAPHPVPIAIPLPETWYSGAAPEFRSAVSTVCAAVDAVRAGSAAAGTVGYFHFPPATGERRAMLLDMLEDFPDLAHSEVGEGGELHIVVYSVGHEPEEVLEAARVEAALEAEAARLREAEAAMFAAAAASAAPVVGGGSRGGGGKGGGSSLAGRKRAAAAPIPVETITVVPLFARRDRRTIAEIQEDIAKRSRINEAGDARAGASEPKPAADGAAPAAADGGAVTVAATAAGGGGGSDAQPAEGAMAAPAAPRTLDDLF